VYLYDMRDELLSAVTEMIDSPLLAPLTRDELGRIRGDIDNLDRLRSVLDTAAGQQQYADSLQRLASCALNAMPPRRADEVVVT